MRLRCDTRPANGALTSAVHTGSSHLNRIGGLAAAAGIEAFTPHVRWIGAQLWDVFVSCISPIEFFNVSWSPLSEKVMGSDMKLCVHDS